MLGRNYDAKNVTTLICIS